MSYESSGMTMTMPMQPAYSGGGGFGGWGGDNSWWIILFLIFGMFGWGGGGWGGGFGGGQNGGVGSEVQRGFDHSSVVTKLDGITQGICDGVYALNNSLMSGFHGVDSSLMSLSSQMSSCCCETQRQIERGFCDVQNSMNSQTQAILGKLSQMEYNDLQGKYQAALSENQALRFQASQTAQNGYIDAIGNSIVARLQTPVPVPSYQVPNPNAVYGCNPCGC